MARLCGGRLMWATCARGMARVFLAFLMVWLVTATPSLAQEAPAEPVNVQAVQTGPNEVTVTFEPGVGGGEYFGFFINAMPAGVGFSTTVSPYVFGGLPEGEQTIGVYAQGVEPDYLDSNTIYVDVTILPAATLTFNAIPTQALGASLDLGPYASATNASGVSFISDTPSVCGVSGQTLVQITLGECRITASATADSGYFPPAPVQQTFMIGADVPGAPTGVTAVAGDGQATVSFTAPGSDGGAAIDLYEVSSSPATGVVTGAGSPITFPGLTNGVTYTFSVRAQNSVGYGAATSSAAVTPKAAQIITFANPGAQNFGTTPILSAVSTSGLVVSLTSGSPSVCTIAAGEVTFLTTGDCIINADQAGDGAYLPAPQVSQTFAVNAVAPGAPTGVTAVFGDGAATVSFSPPTSSGGAPVDGYTVTSSPGGLTASGASSPILISSLVNGTTYSFTVTANNAAGAGAVSSPSNSGTPIADQTITFTNPGSQTFGTSPTLAASASSGLTVVFSSTTPGVCTITPEGLLTAVSAGTCSIDADQGGDAAFAPAATQTQSFDINAVAPGAPTIGTATAGDGQASVTFTPPASNGGAAITLYTVTSSPGGFTGTGSGSPITVAGLANGVSYTFTVTADNTAGTGSASAASNAVTPQAAQTITFNNPGTQNFGTTPTLAASASSGLPVVFSSATTGVCTVSTGGALTFVTAGTCTINVDQPGDGANLPATRVSQTFSVNAVLPGAPVIGSVDFGNGQATVYFSPPSSNGGETILDYTVTASPGGASATGSGSPITVVGLSNGTTYTFTVTARTSAGTGAASSASSGGQPVGPQTISFTATAQQQVGAPASLSATASSGLPVSFSSLTPGICTITSGGALTLIAPGSCTIRASQGGGSGYAAATPVDQSFNVIAATPTAVIPTLTEWAMMLLAGLLALAGAAILNRQRSTANGRSAA